MENNVTLKFCIKKNSFDFLNYFFSLRNQWFSAVCKPRKSTVIPQMSHRKSSAKKVWKLHQNLPHIWKRKTKRRRSPFGYITPLCPKKALEFLCRVHSTNSFYCTRAFTTLQATAAAKGNPICKVLLPVAYSFEAMF